MAITNGYTTLATAKARLGIADTSDDATIEAVVSAVSRQIDNECNRRFYAVSETRYYTALSSTGVWVDDLLSVTTLVTDDDGDRTYDTTWAATDYDLGPYNAALDGQPYSRIDVAPDGNYTFPVGVARGVKVTGSFGYAATTPAAIAEACLLQTARLFRRKDAVFGVVGSADMGQTAVIARIDPDVKMMLAPYRLLVVV